MDRYGIIQTVGQKYHTGNTETGEFSYAKALRSVGKNIRDFQNGTDGPKHQTLDLRFECGRLVVLVECKSRFGRWDGEKIRRQLQDYVRFEKEYTDKRIVAILAETDGDDICVWYGQSVIIDDEHMAADERLIRTMEEYENLCFGRINDKIRVVDSIKRLNDLLHANNINERLRSQFVGTCLLALKNGLAYKDVQETIAEDGGKLSRTDVVIGGIMKILKGLLAQDFSGTGGDEGELNKAEKLAILNRRVLEDQAVSSLDYSDLRQILEFIDGNILPYINEGSTAGQDLLSLFFTTFNKYVGKSDKNQAFTPDHICDFMAKAAGVDRHSRILDPCCGSGAFLVRAMTEAMDDCDSEAERDGVKRNQIYGIEYEEGAFGLASTNMLIHGDGNSNVVKDSMFNRAKWIKEKDINVVLMNPPYNATKNQCDPEYVRSWDAKKKEDPSKGFHYVEWIARQIATDDGKGNGARCRMAVLLPMQCAIGNKSGVREFKERMLKNYTLDAVFSMPKEMFYPGASATACCMIFDLSKPHAKSGRETFFGYYKDDKFIKRKGLGRIELTDGNGESLWRDTEALWLELYRNRRPEPGYSVTRKVTADDEWLAEAYMETDYTVLTRADFQRTANEYAAYLVREGGPEPEGDELDMSGWGPFRFGDLIGEIGKAPAHKKVEMTVSETRREGFVPFVTRTENNNGVDCYVLESDLVKVEDGNAIVIGDTTSTVSYQAAPFGTGDHIIVIRADWLNRYTGLFVVGLLKREQFRYSYSGRAFLIPSIENTVLRLPADGEGNPDWKWMEEYMRRLIRETGMP